MVFVPDVPLPSISEKAKRAKEREEAAARAAEKQARDNTPPSWWTPPPLPETPPTPGMDVEAMAIMQKLQSKRIQGVEATSADIAALYRATAARGIGVRVSADAVRNSLLKRAVDDAVSPGMPSPEILAAGERTFVTGLALALGCTPAQANRVVANASAARA